MNKMGLEVNGLVKIIYLYSALSIKTGRFQNIPLEYRLRSFCSEDYREDECHFMFKCNFYGDLRKAFLDKIVLLYPLFYEMPQNEKWNIIMKPELVKYTAEFVHNAIAKRRSSLYK
jgi:hypothetical protein